MAGFRFFDRLSKLLDVVISSPSDGDVLTYDSSDSKWKPETPSAGGSVATDAIFDAKGDLAVGTGANTASKLPVGANDTIAVAASGETTGIKWEAPAAMWVGKTAPLTVLTAGSPADLGSLPLPAWLTRFMCKNVGSTFRLYADTAAGTLAGATFLVRTAAAGADTSLVSTANGPTAAAGIVVANGLGVAATGTAVFFRQTANSANAGTISFTVEVSLI